MISPMRSSTEVNYVLSPQLLALAEALTPVATTARQALARRTRPSGQDFLIFESVSRHLGLVEQTLSRLTPRLQGLMVDAIRKEEAGPIDVGRSVGRLEQVISELIDGYIEAKASRADAESIQARNLIIGIYRHHIQNICDWLDDLVVAIANPTAALQRRGIEPSGEVVLTVPLHMTSPPEMEKLGALINTLHPTPEESAEVSVRPERPQDDRPGLLGTIGALVFGLGLSDAEFRRRHG